MYNCLTAPQTTCILIYSVTGEDVMYYVRETWGAGSNLIRSPITVYDLRPTTLYIDKTLQITMDGTTPAPTC